MTDIKAAVTTPGFRPRLREGLRFYRDAATPGVVLIHDANRNSRLQLYEIECLIARQMDGTRDLDAITRAAKPHVPWATREHIEKLAVQIAGMGLLSNIHTPASPMANGTPAIMAAQSDEMLDPSELLDDGSGLDDATVLEPQRDDSPPAWSAGLAQRVDAVMAQRESAPMIAQSPPPAPALPPVDVAPAAPAYEPPPPELEPPPPVAPAELPVAEVRPPEPAAEPWVVEKPPWHKRKWMRRLVYLMVPAAIIGILAVIPYPLYVTESCTVIPSQRVHVRTPIDGLIAEIYVGEGDFVQANQPIARLDDRTIMFELQKAEAELQGLKLNLEKKKTGSRPEEVKKAEAHVRTAANDVHFAGRKLKRAIELQRGGVGSIQERDEAQRDLALKRSLLAEAEAELKLVRAGSRSEEVAIAEAEVRRAEAEVKHHKRHLDSLVIRAPIAGRVLTPRFRERMHEKLKEGDLVAEIGDVRVMRIEIEVPERDADVIQVGQAVTLKVHSLPLKAFDGQVRFIAPAIEQTKDGSRILRVDAEISNVESLLQPGMTGYAEIDAGEYTVLGRITRRAVRWVRVRFLL